MGKGKRISIQEGREVNKMKMLTILALAALLLIPANAMAAVAKTATATVDATVQAGTNTLTVSPATLDFGDFPAATAAASRFSSGRDSGSWTAPGPLSVTYFPAAPYEIRVHTDHNVGAGAADTRGYLATTGGDKLFLKVWCLNFGDAAADHATPAERDKGPNPRNNYYWKGYDFNGDGDLDDAVASGSTVTEASVGLDLNGDGDATDTITSTGVGGGWVSATQFVLGESPAWLWMVEQDAMVEGFTGNDEYTRRRLGYNYPSDAELESPFKVHLATDLRGVDAGDYTGTVTFEMYTY